MRDGKSSAIFSSRSCNLAGIFSGKPIIQEMLYVPDNNLFREKPFYNLSPRASFNQSKTIVFEVWQSGSSRYGAGHRGFNRIESDMRKVIFIQTHSRRLLQEPLLQL